MAMTPSSYRALPPRDVTLLPGELRRRAELNRTYLLSLTNANLLQNYYQEAGLWNPRQRPEGIHWGWEAPTCQLRGHFLGHWLSAAASLYAATGDAEAKAKANVIVSELARCQEANGGEWAGSIPEKYLDWIARGRQIWAPHYTVHKTLMGLCDMVALTGSEQALDVLTRWASWFHRWTGQFSRRQLDDILDVETGGMLEVWANLYGVTGREEHLELMQRYDRPRLFERLLAGEDPLTNQHANTTIPEVHGAARAYEVTGDTRWRDIVHAYWRQAVTLRGAYVTGGQTSGEIWSPPQELAARLGDKNQEHCVVYNMMLLASTLLRWTGDPTYADYWEANFYNGILAQQNPHTGMIAYFLPLEPGAVKCWGTPTDDFWCCHGTLVQAHAIHGRDVYYEDDDGLLVAQYLPTELRWRRGGTPVRLRQTTDTQTSSTHRPRAQVVDLTVASGQPAEWTLKLRLPRWIDGAASVELNGEPLPVRAAPGEILALRRTWGEDHLRLTLPRRLASVPLPDDPSRVAFVDGPIALAGLCDDERTLYADGDPASLLAPDNEREWTMWRPAYRTRGQPSNIRFLPLHEIVDQPYTTYFPIAPRAAAVD
ncbi:MAG: hypothetical protein RLZZ387_5517 [Chloroflexota bacterium]|jgi:DUF1680 family protein